MGEIDVVCLLYKAVKSAEKKWNTFIPHILTNLGTMLNMQEKEGSKKEQFLSKWSLHLALQIIAL